MGDLGLFRACWWRQTEQWKAWAQLFGGDGGQGGTQSDKGPEEEAGLGGTEGSPRWFMVCASRLQWDSSHGTLDRGQRRSVGGLAWPLPALHVRTRFSSTQRTVAMLTGALRPIAAPSGQGKHGRGREGPASISGKVKSSPAS